MDTRLPSSHPWSLTVGRVCRHLAFALVLQLAILVHLDSVLWVGPVIPWDDIAFVERSLLNLDWLRGWRSGPLLHAPLGDLQTLMGMGASGFDFRAPYLLNFPHVAALTLFISYYLRSFSRPVRLSATLAVLVFAPTFMLTTQLKSDYKGGLYFSMATLLLFEPGVRDLVSWKRVAVIAACFLLALFAKMTAVYVPAIVLGTVGLHYLRSVGWKLPESSSGSLARYVGLSVCLVTGYGALLAIQWDHLVEYVRWALSDKWSDPRHPGLGHYLFYTPFGESGRYWWVQAALAGALFCSAVFRGGARYRREVLCVALVALTFWVPLLRNSNYNVDFGSYFYYSVVAVLFIGLRSWLDARPHGSSGPVPRWVLVAAPLAAVLSFRSPLLERREWGHLEGGDAALTQISNAIHDARSGLRVTFLFDSLVLPHPNLSVNHRLAHGRLLAMNRVDAFEEVAAALGSTDFAVALDAVSFPALVDLPQWTANVRRTEVVELLDADPRAQLMDTYPVHGGSLRLYRIGRAR
ncbi:MAG: hypothetical protein AAGG01_06990 [Planctomycetota bacterium]